MNRDELEKYIDPGYATLFIAGAIVVLSIVLACVAAKSAQLLVIIIGLSIALLAFRAWHIKRKCYMDFLKTHEEQGDLDIIAADFATAQSWFNDEIRTGNTILFQKRRALLWNYNDILNLHEYVHRTNGMEDNRSLQAVIKGGEKRSIARLRTNGRSNEELFAFYKFIINKNPEATLGYDKALRLDAATLKYGRGKTWICECGQENLISRFGCVKCGRGRQ